MSPSLRDELLLIEDAFVAALSAGGESLSAFETRWQNLTQQLDDAHDSHVLDSDTANVAYITSTRLALLAEASVDIVAIQDDIASELVNELDTLMAELSLLDDGAPLRLNHPAPKPHLVPSTSRKRARTFDETQRPMPKRRRSMLPETPAPSPLKPAYHPATSVLASLAVLDDPDPQSPARQCSEHRNISRKRRLSTAELDPPTKPMKRLYAGPRLHAVSDSYLTLRPTASLKAKAGPPLQPLSHSKPDTVTTFGDPWLSMTNCESGNDESIEIAFAPWNATFSSELCDLDVLLQSLLQPTLPTIALSVPQSSTTFEPPRERSPSVDSPTASTLGSSWYDCCSEDSHSSASSTPKVPLTPPLLPATYSPALTLDDPLSDEYFFTSNIPPLANVPSPLDEGFEICHLQDVTSCNGGYSSIIGSPSADTTVSIPPSVPSSSWLGPQATSMLAYHSLNGCEVVY